MIYKCRACELEVARGFLPTTSNGLWFLLPAGAAFGIAFAMMHVWFPDGLGWWWLLVLPTLIPLALIAAVLLLFALGGIEHLICRRRACARCGARNWSRGYTQGFGA